ncbi:hypothetical protein GIW45_02280 [Pseudomonas congelans]|uniref:hypothetical protein n=1 Tax=Pseudomonas congelans TaxID=200452 RepID=UPI001F2ADB0A|nr:hypothetical protein [Pseudomonas congelans]MCF5162950.1 hypothetical protein [Pseudomonas congelans]
MNSGRNETFDSAMDVFKVHFENDPIVPGMLLLLNELHQRSSPHPPSTCVERLVFKAFVRPDQPVTYLSVGGETRINADSGLCCSFSTRAGELLAAPAFIDQTCDTALHVSPTREPLYWFLPAQISVDKGGTHARTSIDLQLVIARHPYLAEITYPGVLVLTEALGNLALALQHKHAGGPAASYVFAKFDALHMDLNRKPGFGTLHLHTQVRHFGSFLVWDACAWDEYGVRLVIHNAISVKRKNP